jgi:hypothetical protein
VSSSGGCVRFEARYVAAAAVIAHAFNMARRRSIRLTGKIARRWRKRHACHIQQLSPLYRVFGAKCKLHNFAQFSSNQSTRAIPVTGCGAEYDCVTSHKQVSITVWRMQFIVSPDQYHLGATLMIGSDCFAAICGISSNTRHDRAPA